MARTLNPFQDMDRLFTDLTRTPAAVGMPQGEPPRPDGGQQEHDPRRTLRRRWTGPAPAGSAVGQRTHRTEPTGPTRAAHALKRGKALAPA